MVAGAAPAGATTRAPCARFELRLLAMRRRPDFINAPRGEAASVATGGGAGWMTYFAPVQALDRLLRAAVSDVIALAGTPWSAYRAALSSPFWARTRRVFTIDG